jgi:hypothetical protein
MWCCVWQKWIGWMYLLQSNLSSIMAPCTRAEDSWRGTRFGNFPSGCRLVPIWITVLFGLTVQAGIVTQFQSSQSQSLCVTRRDPRNVTFHNGDVALVSLSHCVCTGTFTPFYLSYYHLSWCSVKIMILGRCFNIVWATRRRYPCSTIRPLQYNCEGMFMFFLVSRFQKAYRFESEQNMWFSPLIRKKVQH